MTDHAEEEDRPVQSTRASCSARRVGEWMHCPGTGCLLSGHHRTAAPLGRPGHTRIGRLVQCRRRSTPGRVHQPLVGATGYLFGSRSHHTGRSHPGIRCAEATKLGEEGTCPRWRVAKHRRAGSSNHLTMRTLAEVAQAVHVTASSLIAATGEVARAFLASHHCDLFVR